MKKIKLFLLGFAIIVVSCSKKDESGSTSVLYPKITKISATHAKKNAELIITGTGFGTDSSKVKVLINNKLCKITNVSNTAIKFIVPVKCGSGDVVVKVGNNESNKTPFTYDWTYTLTSITNGREGYLDGPLENALWKEQAALCIDNNDNIYTAAYSWPIVRKISSDLKNVTTIAGNGEKGDVDGQGTNARLGQTDNIAIDMNGIIYYADQSVGNIKKIDQNGNVKTFIANLPYNIQSVHVAKSGNVYLVGLTSITKYTSSGKFGWIVKSKGNGTADGDTTKVQFNEFLSWGNLYIDDKEENIYFGEVGEKGADKKYHSRVRKLNIPAMTVTTIAGALSGDVVDGDAQTATFNLITSIVADNEGGFYIGDGFGNKIRYLKDGKVSTIINGNQGKILEVDGDASVATINYPNGMAMNSKGELFIAANNNKVKKMVKD